MQTKEEFKIRLLEQQIYEELKDGYFGGVGYIRQKYDGSGIDASKVYRWIVNYRIKVYGTSTFLNPSFIVYKTRGERKRDAVKARQRKYYRRNK